MKLEVRFTNTDVKEKYVNSLPEDIKVTGTKYSVVLSSENYLAYVHLYHGKYDENNTRSFIVIFEKHNNSVDYKIYLKDIDYIGEIQ